MALSSNFDAFKVQTLENILAQTAAPTVLEWPSYGNFCEVIQRGEQGKFYKIVQKVNLVCKAEKHSCANSIIL